MSLFALLLPAAAQGQLLLLAGDTAGTALYLNPARVWNYNHYEHSRWGVGLTLELQPRQADGTRTGFDASVGYGLLDRQWKFGLTYRTAFGRSRSGLTQYIHLGRDYRPAGSRRLSTAPLGGLSMLAGFMSYRMVDMYVATWGYGWQADGTKHQVDGSFGMGARLFDNQRLLYRSQGDTLRKENQFVLRWLMRLPAGLATQVEAGAVLSDRTAVVARLLVQYRRTVSLQPFDLRIHAQTGATLPRTPYTYMFDLGGTWGTSLYVDGLATLHPNEFTSNLFAFANLRLQTQSALYSYYNEWLNVGGNPRPFVQLNALWGMLWGQDADGRLAWEGLDLQAPCMGLLEPTVGIDGLLRWGAVDWGVALACRLAPTQACYRWLQSRDNLMLLITASIIN